MTIHRAFKIRDELATFLADITTSNGYNFTISKVFEYFVLPPECNEDVFASVFIQSMSSDDTPSSEVDGKARLCVLIHGKLADGWQAKRDALAADFEKKLATDRSINDSTSYARITEWAFDEFPDEGWFTIAAFIDAQLLYGYTNPGI